MRKATWHRSPTVDGEWWLSISPDRRVPEIHRDVEPVTVQGDRVKIGCVTVFLDMPILVGSRWMPRNRPADPFCHKRPKRGKKAPWHAPDSGERSGHTFCGIYYRRMGPGVQGLEFFYKTLKITRRDRILAQTSCKRCLAAMRKRWRETKTL